jgi:hypothetical protein
VASSAPAASSSGAGAAGAPAKWSGSYTATAGDLYYPRNAPNAKDWSDLKWNGADAGVGLGNGTVTLVVDPATKRVTGTVDGALGDAVVTGAVDGDHVTAAVTRKDPTDHGLTGTLVGDVKDGALAGEMKLSSPDAQILRDAKFSLAKQAP